MNEMNQKMLDMRESGDDLLELLKTGAKIPLVVTGSSMMPFLRHKKDTVWLIRPEKLRRGQILFFRRRDGSLILHRIRRIFSDGTMLVNGDAQNWCEKVWPEQAAAVVCAVTRNGKTRNADNILWKIRDLLWYPTRPVRPALFRIYGGLRKLFR
jgi:hypothetical protein